MSSKFWSNEPLLRSKRARKSAGNLFHEKTRSWQGAGFMYGLRLCVRKGILPFVIFIQTTLSQVDKKKVK